MEDMISRKAAIDAVKKNTFRLTFAEEQNCEGHVAWSAEAVYSDVIEGALLELPSEQPETHEERTETHACDCISRQAAISVIAKWMLEYGGEGEEHERNALKQAAEEIKDLPSAQPERLTDDDFETIRIHLNAYKEKLCNQHRWEEANEYQRIIDRFMAFASAQPEIIRCEDCKYNSNTCGNYVNCNIIPQMFGRTVDNFCSRAKRKERTDG